MSPHHTLTCSVALGPLPLAHTSQPPFASNTSFRPLNPKPVEMLHPAALIVSFDVKISGPLSLQNCATGIENWSTPCGFGAKVRMSGEPVYSRWTGSLM